jgi:penicillin-binding protein 2
MQLNNLQNQTGSSARKNGKLLVLSIIIIIIFILYTLKLFSLQVIQGDQYRKQSVTISQQVKTIPAQRGEIFDRNATLPLVVNTDSFAVDIVPGEIPSGYYDTVAMKLSKYLDIGKNEIDYKVPSNKRNTFSSIEIKTNVPFEVISNIAENITDLPGVSWRSKPIRNYVETGSMCHVIGYVGDITKDEINVMYNKGYKTNSIVGKTGIEKQYDSLLQGVPGRESHTVDVRGHVLNDTPIIEPPQTGKNLVLTIDSRIQKLAEQALGERVGAVVVLKPATGEVLAMVSYPFFNANLFSTDDAAAEYTRLAGSENNPLLNRAVNAVYPPASTFKTIMTTAVLNEKALPAEKKIECTGKIIYGDRTFKCHKPAPGHGWLDLKNGLAQSCDVYFWIVGRDYLGVDKISSYAKEFGFGQSLQIDLPAQSDGFVPTAQWKERRYHEKWLGGDTMNMSIGQGYTLVTPLHIADMMAMVCNSGVVYKPHLLKEVRDPATDKVIEEIQPEVMLKSTIAPDVWKKVQADLRYVITDGTAIYPMKNKIQIAGKTGTAEVNGYEKNHWHSWMVAYAPYDAPVEDQIVVATLVEAVNKWQWWAPYATNIIIQGIFNNQTYDESIDVLGFRYITEQGRRE